MRSTVQIIFPYIRGLSLQIIEEEKEKEKEKESEIRERKREVQGEREMKEKIESHVGHLRQINQAFKREDRNKDGDTTVAPST